jgi:DNA-binding IscR family transcriptional regulator
MGTEQKNGGIQDCRGVSGGILLNKDPRVPNILNLYCTDDPIVVHARVVDVHDNRCVAGKIEI